MIPPSPLGILYLLLQLVKAEVEVDDLDLEIGGSRPEADSGTLENTSTEQPLDAC